MNQAAQGGIQIRGFSSSDILVLLDGLPMNTTYSNGMEWEMVPVEKIARIEVVRGAGSSLYGGRAVGAVVNIITKDNPEKKGASVNAVVSYGSNNTWKKALYADARVNKKLSFGVGYENRKSDGYRGCLLYTSDAADDTPCVDLGGRRIIKKIIFSSRRRHTRFLPVSWARRCV